MKIIAKKFVNNYFSRIIIISGVFLINGCVGNSTQNNQEQTGNVDINSPPPLGAIKESNSDYILVVNGDKITSCLLNHVTGLISSGCKDSIKSFDQIGGVAVYDKEAKISSVNKKGELILYSCNIESDGVVTSNCSSIVSPWGSMQGYMGFTGVAVNDSGTVYAGLLGSLNEICGGSQCISDGNLTGGPAVAGNNFYYGAYVYNNSNSVYDLNIKSCGQFGTANENHCASNIIKIGSPKIPYVNGIAIKDSSIYFSAFYSVSSGLKTTSVRKLYHCFMKDEFNIDVPSCTEFGEQSLVAPFGLAIKENILYITNWGSNLGLTYYIQNIFPGNRYFESDNVNLFSSAVGAAFYTAL